MLHSLERKTHMYNLYTVILHRYTSKILVPFCFPLPNRKRNAWKSMEHLSLEHTNTKIGVVTRAVGCVPSCLFIIKVGILNQIYKVDFAWVVVGRLHQVAPGCITRRGPSSRCWTTLFRIDSRISRSGSESRFTPKKSKVQGLEANKISKPLGRGIGFLGFFFVLEALAGICSKLSFSFWTHAFWLYFRLGIFNGPPRSNSLWETHSTNRPQFED